MSVCVTVTRLFLDPRNVFPVLDPRRTAGTGPYKYGYMLTWDGLQVTVTRDPALSNCEMTVVATAATLLPPEKMDIWGLNLFSNAWTTGVGTAATGLPTDMRIRRRGRLGQSCNDGTDTVLLRCSKERGIWPASEYLFAPEDFWDFWGGCTVQFDWVSNTSGSGLLGNQTPAPTYPMVRRPDGTFMRQDIPIDEDHETQKYFVVFGGPPSCVAMATSLTWDCTPATPLLMCLFRPPLLTSRLSANCFGRSSTSSTAEQNFSFGTRRHCGPLPPSGGCRRRSVSSPRVPARSSEPSP
jgi:hypothetical protein